MAKTSKSVRYVGPFDQVDVVLPDGTVAHVAHNETLDTTAAFAESLCEQETNWQPVTAASSEKEE